MSKIETETVTNIDARIEEAKRQRRLASDTEVNLHRRMALAGDLVEETGAEIDALLDEKVARRHALDPVTTPEDRAEIAAAWAGFEAQPEPAGYAEARRAVLTLARTIPWDGQPVTAYPGMVQDEHGCWLIDEDDEMAQRYPDLRFGCSREW